MAQLNRAPSKRDTAFESIFGRKNSRISRQSSADDTRGSLSVYEESTQGNGHAHPEAVLNNYQSQVNYGHMPYGYYPTSEPATYLDQSFTASGNSQYYPYAPAPSVPYPNYYGSAPSRSYPHNGLQIGNATNGLETYDYFAEDMQQALPSNFAHQERFPLDGSTVTGVEPSSSESYQTRRASRPLPQPPRIPLNFGALDERYEMDYAHQEPPILSPEVISNIVSGGQHPNELNRPRMVAQSSADRAYASRTVLPPVASTGHRRTKSQSTYPSGSGSYDYMTDTSAPTSPSTRGPTRPSVDLSQQRAPGRDSMASERSYSFGSNSARPEMKQVTSSAVVTASRRAPIVYPAMLSKVAEAFKARIVLSERIKDGLAYKDAFDGREAVDKISYIIKTTDRNLALLLGRALDAQKYFHDVTYEHRLRDSPNEIYQFREHLPSPFVSLDEIPGTEIGDGDVNYDGYAGLHRLSSDHFDLPVGVFTLLTDCYSPTCTRDRLCYSIACPRRLEQQARLNMKPQPGLKRSDSRASLSDVKQTGVLWADSVAPEIVEAVSETERMRQEAINELIYTERDFVKDLEYLRDTWIRPLRQSNVIPEVKRVDFVRQVFWNLDEIHGTNARLSELLNRRQNAYAVVDRVGDIFLEIVPHFAPFVRYGSHQLYGKYEFEREKGSNSAFSKFVEETERLSQSRKLELNGYLTKPTTRLARYPLLLEAVLKHTPSGNPDSRAIPEVMTMIREFLKLVNQESGRSENRFHLGQLDQQLVWKSGEAVDLRLKDEGRELIFKGSLKKSSSSSESSSSDLHLFLFDHALLMVKHKIVSKHDQYKVHRKPIPLELLAITLVEEQQALGKSATSRPKSLMPRASSNKVNGSKQAQTTAVPITRNDTKGYAITFEHLGRKGYAMTLFATTYIVRKKWMDSIIKQQEILRERSRIFETVTTSERFFVGGNKVSCACPLDYGNKLLYGTESGVYMTDLGDAASMPTKVLATPGVSQIEVLEDWQIILVLSERSLFVYPLDALDPFDMQNNLKKGRKISSNTSFFRTGICLGRVLVAVVKSSSLSTTIKILEPTDPSSKNRAKPAFTKLLQGRYDPLKVCKEFYVPTEATSIHYLKSKLCVGCNKGFEIVDMETLDTQGLLDPADSSLDFVQRRESLKPIAIYRIEGEFLLCYDDFAFYVNKNGWRARGTWSIQWEGCPTQFALHYPYILAFEASFIEIRHVETAALMQILPGSNIRLLYADGGGSSSGSLSHNGHPAPFAGTTYASGWQGGPSAPIIYTSEDKISDWSIVKGIRLATDDSSAIKQANTEVPSVSGKQSVESEEIFDEKYDDDSVHGIAQ